MGASYAEELDHQIAISFTYRCYVLNVDEIIVIRQIPSYTIGPHHNHQVSLYLLTD